MKRLLPILTGLALLTPALTSHPASAWPAFPTASPDDVMYVAGSTKKLCQLTGETDFQLNVPTASQTGSRYGLFGADLGYSFEHDGKLFFLFGDAMPMPTFHGKPNGKGDPLRNPDDNDAIGYATVTNPGQCPRLDFATDANGAFRSPVVLNDQGQPAIKLRTDEQPIAGISAGGRMYVIFATDNYLYPTPGPTTGNLGFATRTVIAVSDDDTNTFHYLYDLSAGPGAKFINVAIAQGDDGYLYFWGTQGGMLWRHSAPYVARKLANAMDQPGGMEYFAGLGTDGQPGFSASEADATALFADYTGDGTQPKDCMGELGVAWNQFVNRWIMLYNCADRTAANLPGIYMRLAAQPWGPWSAPQTIFNGGRDGGVCQFIHRAVTPAMPACDDLSTPARAEQAGGPYAPYFVGRFATGDAACGTSTLYYTMATFNPYTQNLMQTSIQGPPSGEGGGAGPCSASSNQPSSGPATAYTLSVPAGWALISSPGSAQPIDGLLGTCALGGGPWGWDGTQYQPATSILPGTGYWVYFDQPCTMQTTGAPAAPHQQPLVSGWNLVSSASSWNDINAGNCSLLEGPWWFDGGQYQLLTPDASMTGFRGYWVDVSTSCTVTS